MKEMERRGLPERTDSRVETALAAILAAERASDALLASLDSELSEPQIRGIEEAFRRWRETALLMSAVDRGAWMAYEMRSRSGGDRTR